MKIMIVMLIVVIFVLSLFIYKLFHELNSIHKQVEIKVHTDSNFLVSSDLHIKTYTALCNDFNRIYDKYRGEKTDSVKREKEFKEMLSYIAHDVRTPLTSVQGYLQILKEKDVDEANEEYYKIINRRIYDIRNLLEQFFIYSKLLNRDYQLEVEKCNLYNVCCDSLANFYQTFSNKHMEPHIDFEQQDVMIYANQDLIKRVFDNVIQNALVHGDGNIRITQNGNRFIISNKLKAEGNIDKEKVFERFYKADSSRTTISSGLGLAIVKEIIELCNWKVHVDIQDTTFILTITFDCI